MPEHLKTTPEKTFDVGHIVRKIGTSEAYVRARNTVERQDMAESKRRPAAVHMAAVALRGKEEGAHFTLEEHALNLTAHLATLDESFLRLAKLRDRHARRSEKMPYLKKVTEFNHALKDTIDSNPRLGFNEVVGFLRHMNQQVHGRHTDTIFEHGVRTALEGMRHEIAVEQMLGHLGNVEYEHVSTAEDLSGSDLKVSIDGSPMFPIDIKASYLTAEHSRDKARQTGYDTSHIIWSGVNDEDFNGGFRISQETAAEKAPQLERAIRNALYRIAA